MFQSLISDPVRLHRAAVATMVLCALLWSLSGIVTRRLDHAEGFEVTLWRSLFAGLFVAAWLALSQRGSLVSTVRAMGWVGFASGVFWAVMFTCFMLAIVMTTVAKAMVVLALAPLLAALLAWALLGERIPARTWGAIALAGAGTVWMVAEALKGGDGYPHSGLGMLIAAGVPLASAANLVLMKRTQARVDLVPAVFLGSVISCIAMLPFVFPLEASLHDVAWLAFLGVFQLGLPCVLLVIVARYLSPQETALLALLEVVFAPLWVWIGAGERPANATLWGGALVLVALVGNEALGMHRRGAGKLARLA